MADFKKNNKVNTPLLLLIICILGFGAVIVLYPVYLKKEKLRESNYKLHEQLKLKEYKRAELSRKVYGLYTDPVMVEKVAREKFRLCREGEVILFFDEKESDMKK